MVAGEPTLPQTGSAGSGLGGGATGFDRHVTTIHRKKEAALNEIKILEEQLKDIELKIETEKIRIGYDDEEYGADELLEMGIRRFNNKSPNKGIKFLIEKGYFSEGGTPKEIAQFLFDNVDGDNSHTHLSKAGVGEYLGDFKDLNLEVLKEFSKIHELKGLDFNTSLRQYLWSFRLPGESQKIDRMMESFASRYCECNPGDFGCVDACYILSFATIMLNTSLHNPNARGMTIETFISMGRKIDKDEDGNERDIPDSLMKQTYGNILATPFKIPDDENGFGYTFSNPDKNGWLSKQGEGGRGWKKYWVVINNSCLYYFKKKDDETPVGIVPLENLVVTESQTPKFMCFVLGGAIGEDGKPMKIKGCKTNSKGMVIEGNHKQYVFKVEDGGESGNVEREITDWVNCIEANLGPDTAFADLYATRRRMTLADEIQ